MLLRTKMLAPLFLAIFSQMTNAQQDFLSFDDIAENDEYSSSYLEDSESEDFSTLLEREYHAPGDIGKDAKLLADFMTSSYFDNQLLFLDKVKNISSQAGAELFAAVIAEGRVDLAEQMLTRGFDIITTSVQAKDLVCRHSYELMSQPAWKKVRDYILTSNEGELPDPETMTDCLNPNFPNVGLTAIMVEHYQKPEHPLTESMAAHLSSQIIVTFVNYMDMAISREEQDTLVFLGKALPMLTTHGAAPDLTAFRRSSSGSSVIAIPAKIMNPELITVLGSLVMPYLDITSKAELTIAAASRTDISPLAAYIVKSADSNDILQAFSTEVQLLQSNPDTAIQALPQSLATLALSCQIPQNTLGLLSPDNPLVAGSLEYCGLYGIHTMSGIMRACISGKGEIGNLSYCQTLQKGLSGKEKAIISAR